MQYTYVGVRPNKNGGPASPQRVAGPLGGSPPAFWANAAEEHRRHAPRPSDGLRLPLAFRTAA
eukprot:6864220-Pyramimonas_sp.AAC.1